MSLSLTKLKRFMKNISMEKITIPISNMISKKKTSSEELLEIRKLLSTVPSLSMINKFKLLMRFRLKFIQLIYQRCAGKCSNSFGASKQKKKISEKFLKLTMFEQKRSQKEIHIFLTELWITATTELSQKSQIRLRSDLEVFLLLNDLKYNSEYFRNLPHLIMIQLSAESMPGLMQLLCSKIVLLKHPYQLV